MPSELRVDKVSSTASPYTPVFSTTGGALSHRNIIINGAMQVAQRGTSGFTTHNAYTLDRWRVYENSTNGSFTVSQDTDAPANFKNSLKFLVGSAGTTSTNSVSHIRYFVEGNDFAHLNFGTSDAKTYTVSFWVKSSVTGTYCLSARNNDNNRAIVKEYTINTANTWEYKTITIAGDTSGTYLTNNGIGIVLFWDLGSDSAFDQTADTYSSTDSFKTSNQTAFIGNAGATFYLTGVQLELGSVATPFEHRSYGDELARCQRYYQRLPDASGSGSAYASIGTGFAGSGTQADIHFDFKTAMRASPAFSFNGMHLKGSGFAYNVTSITSTYFGSNSGFAVVTASSGSMAGGDTVILRRNNSNSDYIELDAEL